MERAVEDQGLCRVAKGEETVLAAKRGEMCAWGHNKGLINERRNHSP
jgi:hypothetical protein